MRATAVRALTGAATKAEGLRVLYARLEARAGWMLNGRGYRLAGYDRGRDRVHFTATWSAGEQGGIGHSRVCLPLGEALARNDGDLTGASRSALIARQSARKRLFAGWISRAAAGIMAAPKLG